MKLRNPLHHEPTISIASATAGLVYIENLLAAQQVNGATDISFKGLIVSLGIVAIRKYVWSKASVEIEKQAASRGGELTALQNIDYEKIVASITESVHNQLAVERAEKKRQAAARKAERDALAIANTATTDRTAPTEG